jgi:rRNA-processing protein FCF1
MLVTPLPGANRTNLLEALQQVHKGAVDARSFSGHAVDRCNTYMRWALDAVRMLRHQIAESDLERLVMTRAFWALQGGGMGVESVGWLVDAELDHRVSMFEEARDDLAAQIARWSPYNNWAYVVPDTSFFIQHPQKVEELDLSGDLGLRGQGVHLLVPIAVVDELDGLKQDSNAHVRWRARHTLQVLDQVLPNPEWAGELPRADFSPVIDGFGIPRGQVTVEIVIDPPGHARLPITDEEIVDRALTFQVLAGQRVIMITYDTGQSTRARGRGLKVIKFDQPPEGDEPERGGRRTAGRNRKVS